MKAISMINMKGGVGKTATTVNLASYIAKDYDRKILIVDLDPQTNATFSLLTSEKWTEWTQNHGTLYDVLDLERTANINGGVVDELDITECIIDNVVEGEGQLDLLPSHLKCVDMDIKLARFPNTHALLLAKLEPIQENYDYIFCDCPPNLSLITQNGMKISDYYMVPIEPDFLAAIGAGLLKKRVEFLKKILRINIELLGVVFTKVRKNEIQMRGMMGQLKAEFGNKVFNTIIPKNVAIPRASERAVPVFDFEDNSTSANAYKELAEEFLERIGDTDE